MSKNQQFDYITYGAKVNSEQVLLFLQHIFNNTLNSAQAKPPTPVCIWGFHGIGKTEIVKDTALAHGYQFVYIAPAQFEEMGDLIGMPKIESMGNDKQVTHFIAPDWVPATEGPGIFLIDDVNRADDRILRGIMQLLQNYELVSWKLPKKWLIVLTANPDGGDYSVTTMDEAMLTRMIHVTLEFDVKSWAKWAQQAGIDTRGIEFVLTYPEIVTGQRTTPRSLVQFFDAIKSLNDLRQNIELVKMLADGCLDNTTTVAFINFVNMDLDKLIAPEEILNSGDFKIIEGQVKKLMDGATKRLDILSVIMTRLTNFLLFSKTDLSDKQFSNLTKFTLLDIIPNDLRLAMAQDLVKSDIKSMKKLYAIPEIGKLLLAKM
ncbi:MAG: AAA family ATPase [Ferruginibacter sp.]